MDWFWYALLAACSFTAYSILVRQCLKNDGDAKTFSLLACIVVGIMLLLVAPFERSSVNLTRLDVFLIVAAGSLYAIEGTFLVWARQLEEISSVEIVRQTGIIWGFAGGVLMLGEPVSPLKVLGSSLILVGGIAAMWKGHRFELSKGLTLVVVAAATFTFTAVVNRLALEEGLSPAFYGGTISLVAALCLLLVLSNTKERIVRELKLQRGKIIWVNAMLAITFFAMMSAYQRGDASLVVPVLHTSLIFAVVGGIVFMGERDRLLQKLIAAGVAFVGILFLRLL